ncbi:hypothetical protein [Rheinheimera faecalis]|uniref:hypothetical protein n=1 Tax=Rheinheimera faecalis TaxID=2901141 RepID=UPI001E440BC9|nr:hypothetical protein [Rheinheimera faecalis]
MGKILLYLSSFFLVFENTALSAIGGAFTAPLAISLFPAVTLYLLFNFYSIDIVGKRIIYFIFGVLFFSLAYLFIFADSLYFGFLLDRGLRLFLINLASFVFLVFFLTFDYAELKVASKISGILIVMVFFINLVAPDIVNNPSFLQGSAAFSPDRMRGFTLEASTFGFQVVTAVMLLAIVFSVNYLLSIVVVVSFLLFTSSKGALLAFCLSVVISKFVLAKSGFNKITFLIVGFLAFSFGFYYVLLDAFILDIEKYNSSSTRGVMIFTGIYSALVSPFGVGFTGYFNQIYQLGPDVINFVDYYFPNLFNFDEVVTYFIVGNVESVSTKTLFFDWLIYAGWVFLYLFYKFLSFCFSKIKGAGGKNLSLFIFMIISWCFYVPLDGRIIGLLAIATLIKFNRERGA